MKKLIIIFICFSMQVSLASREEKRWAETKLSPILVPKNRIVAGFKNAELTQHKYFERYQTLYGMLEYSFLENDTWSMFLSLPYTKKWLTDSQTTRRLDNMHIGTRFGIIKSNHMILFGLDGELATGNEKEEGIGSKELGSLEPYFGFLYQKEWMFSSSLRYNAQTNKDFKEKENQEFMRTFYFDFMTGYRFSWADILLEYKYMYRTDPEPHSISNHTIAPTINFFPNDTMQISLSIPYALSREREFDIGAELEVTAFY